MTEAERVADRKSREIAAKNRARAKEVEKAWSSAGKIIAGSFAGLSIAGVFRSFIQESIAAQEEQAQLAAVLRSTGEAAGYTAEQLNKMSADMAGSSVFSEGEITKAQTRLLSYTGIVGEQFPEAMQAVIDMAARMGMSVEQSAETIGRALDIPSQGLSALQRQGFRFTETQKKAVEELERTGRVAEAQAIVLDALKTSYGGAAAAARDTFGGAAKALQNQLRSLMTGSDGSLEGAKDAINDLTDALGSEETKASFAAFTAGLATITSGLVSAGTEFISFGSLIGRELARITTGLAPIDELKAQLNDLDRALNNSFLNKPLKYLMTNREELERMRDAVKAQIAAIEGAAQGPAAAVVTGSRAPSPEEQARLAREKELREQREKAAKESAQQANQYIENLRRQLQATEDLSAAETVLADIRAGRLRGSKSQQDAAMDIARQIDAYREWQQVVEHNAQTERQASEEREKYWETIDRLTGRAIARQKEYERAVLDAAFAAGDISFVEHMVGTYEETTKAIEKTSDAAEQLALTFSSSIGTFIEQGGGIRDFFDSLMQDLLKLTTQLLIMKPLAEGLTEAFGGSKATSSGGQQIAGWGNMIAEFFKSFAGGFAAGGQIPAGQWGLVGERGPELVSGPANVTPMGRGGNVINITIAGNADSRTVTQIGAEVSRRLNIANTRNN